MALVSFQGSEITLSGGLFDHDVSDQLRRNVGQHVRELTRKGQRLVREGIVTKNGTGFTARHVEAYQDARYRPFSLYGKVRMDPDAVRAPGSARWPAKRRPFVTAAVLESGRYGGRHVNRVTVGTRARTRRRWQHSASKRQRPLFMFRRAARVIRADARLIRDDLLTRGL